ncbi:MAG: hypothetical protein MJ238_03410, partial [Bacilli bacterium]|nr:hypothetical protein [Bacilli bacterium]
TVLSAVAVVSTGFASWVITAGDSETVEGTIKVDTVTDNAHDIKEFTWDSTNGDVYFGAPKTMSNSSAWLTNDTDKAEVLTVTATFVVTNATTNDVFTGIVLAEKGSGTKYSTAFTAGYAAALQTLLKQLLHASILLLLTTPLLSESNLTGDHILATRIHMNSTTVIILLMKSILVLLMPQTHKHH